MKINFQNLNIEPMPNPKPLSVERINVGAKPDATDASKMYTPEYGFIRNSRVDPAAHTGRG